jgi:hypothetical protein
MLDPPPDPPGAAGGAGVGGVGGVGGMGVGGGGGGGAGGGVSGEMQVLLKIPQVQVQTLFSQCTSLCSQSEGHVGIA